jgi:hypothetical protein
MEFFIMQFFRFKLLLIKKKSFIFADENLLIVIWIKTLYYADSF